MISIVKHSIALPKTHRDRFGKEAAAIVPNPEKPYPELLAAAREWANYLTPLQPMLQKLTQPHGLPYQVVNNLPVDPQLPPPPTDGQRPAAKTTWVSELTLLAIAKAANLSPLSYLEEKAGLLIHEVVPIPGLENSNSNAGRVNFPWHSDDCHLLPKYRPQFLLLAGLVNQFKTATWIVSVDDALPALRATHPECEPILREPRYRFSSPQSFDYNGNTIFSKPQPLITRGANGENEIAGNLATLMAIDDEAKAAIAAFTSVLKPPVAKAIILQPGSLLIFNNMRCLHARDAVKGDRWLQRIYARTSLDELQQATRSDANSYVFDSRLIALS